MSKKIMYRPDVDRILQLLQETLKDCAGIRIWPSGDAYHLTVDIYGSAGRDPVLNLDDLEKIADALLECRTEWRRRLDILFYPTAGLEGSTLSFQIYSRSLKKELLVAFETNA